MLYVLYKKIKVKISQLFWEKHQDYIPNSEILL